MGGVSVDGVGQEEGLQVQFLARDAAFLPPRADPRLIVLIVKSSLSQVSTTCEHLQSEHKM